MAERKSIIPEGYEEREFSLDDYIKMKVDEALRNEAEREYGVGRPSSLRKGEFREDVATATGDYGDGYTAYTMNDLAKVGFRPLAKGEKPAPGDLARLPYYVIDKDGKKRVDEGDLHFVRNVRDGGFEGGEIVRMDKSYNRGGLFKPGVLYDGWTTDNPVYYRFAGTDEDRSEIEQHNERVRQLKKDAQPIKAEMPTPERITTAEWLGKILRK